MALNLTAQARADNPLSVVAYFHTQVQPMRNEIMEAMRPACSPAAAARPFTTKKEGGNT